MAYDDDAFTLPPHAVKICGLRQPEHAAAAAAAGADLVGFVFAPSRRRIDVATARGCIVAARQAAENRRLLTVGVFVKASADELNDTADAAGLDVLQLNGDLDEDVLPRLRFPALRALNPVPGTPAAAVDEAIATSAAQQVRPIAYLIDGFRAGEYGGMGVRADWGLAQRLSRRWPIVLAGGLTPENIEEAILAVAPNGVDVSSGIETEGVKDIAKIRTFVQRARAAFAQLNE